MDVALSCTFAVLFLATVGGTQGLICYNSNNIRLLAASNHVKECGPAQSCYMDVTLNQDGMKTYELGCRDTSRCAGSTVVGRRAGALMICSECCDSNLCQRTTSLCGETALPTDRGPLCYQCDAIGAGFSCSTVDMCSRDEICYESFALSSLSHHNYKSGCFDKLGCQHSEQQIGQIPRHCFKCCENDTCNTGCQTSYTNAPTRPAATTTINTQSGFTSRPTGGPTIPGCADRHSPQLCKALAAAAITCHNVTMATNVGCLFTCGFCYTG